MRPTLPLLAAICLSACTTAEPTPIPTVDTAASDADCKLILQCATWNWGWCTWDADKKTCVIGPDGCKDLDKCKRGGQCHRVDDDKAAVDRGKCVALTQADCDGTLWCKTGGNCTYDGEGGCWPGSDADCEQSDTCKDEGFCSYNASKGCMKIDSDAVCKASNWCKKHSRCYWDGDKSCVASKS